MSPATPAIADTCSYTATVNGGIDGFGNFRVSIVHNGKTTIVDSASPPSQPTCYAEGPRTLCPIGIVQPGDQVTVRASTPAFAGVGNPCPVPNDGVPPPILGGKC